jgi:hypothetical protein
VRVLEQQQRIGDLAGSAPGDQLGLEPKGLVVRDDSQPADIER